MESHELDLAIAGGYFSGEGCISASCGVAGKWNCQISLGSRERDQVVFFQRAVGTGSVFQRKDRMWMFQASTAKAAHVLKQIYPYLIGSKKKQAQLFLEYAKLFTRHYRGAGLPVELAQQRLALAKQIQSLKTAFRDNGGNSVETQTG